MRKRVIALIAALALLSGCAATPATLHYSVQVDSIKRNGGKKSYVMLPGNYGVSPQDLQYLEFAEYVKRALKKQGFVEAGTAHQARIAIFLRYGIGDPKTHHYTYTVPTFGQTGTQTTTNAWATGSFGGFASYQSRTTPTYGVTGTQTYTGSYVTYTRYIILEAIDLDVYNRNQTVQPVWKTKIVSTGSSGDLRAVFPIILAASQDYIGRNTESMIDLDISGDDPRIDEIKGHSFTEFNESSYENRKTSEKAIGKYSNDTDDEESEDEDSASEDADDYEDENPDDEDSGDSDDEYETSRSLETDNDY